MTAVEFLLDFESKYPRLQSMVSTEEDKKFFYSTAQGAQVTCDVMIEFAKMHVKKALEAADKKAEDEFGEKSWDLVNDKNFILNAYPETLII